MKKLLLIFLSFSISINAQLCDPNSNSLFFDGQSHVSFNSSNDLDITDEITLEAWIYPTMWGAEPFSGSIICKHGWTQGEEGYVLRAGGNGQLSFNFFGVKQNGHLEGWKEVRSSAGSLQLNEWSHVAATYDGNKFRLYINGTLSETESFHGKILSTSNYKLKIGRIADEAASNGRYWNGMIDEVRIWSRALSQSDLSSDMDHHLNVQTVNDLVGYWRFNDRTGVSVGDRGSGNNDGTISSTQWSIYVPFTNGITKPSITEVSGKLFSSSLFGNQWNRNGIPIQGETGIQFDPVSSGVYSLTVDYGFGCVATSDQFTIALTGINDISGKQILEFYISNNMIYFISPTSEFFKSNISLYDIDGRSFIQNEKFSEQFNLSNISAGIYIMFIQSATVSFRTKIFVY